MRSPIHQWPIDPDGNLGGQGDANETVFAAPLGFHRFSPLHPNEHFAIQGGLGADVDPVAPDHNRVRQRRDRAGQRCEEKESRTKIEGRKDRNGRTIHAFESNDRISVGVNARHLPSGNSPSLIGPI